MKSKIDILAISGSLRRDSYNSMLLQAVKELVPESAEMEIFDISSIPLYNQDIENTMPEVVKEFKARISKADALIIATPEYNYSVPGVLKNAIDWASRPYMDNSFDQKPLAIMGATVGTLGTVRAQNHLRQIAVSLNMQVVNRPEIMISRAQDKFKDGKLIDDTTKKFIGITLDKLLKMI